MSTRAPSVGGWGCVACVCGCDVSILITNLTPYPYPYPHAYLCLYAYPQVACVIMSGGQGTRLGFDGPKGMYKIGVPSGSCIFRLHMEKILAVRALAARTAVAAAGGAGGGRSGSASLVLPSIPVYIMTSEINTERIKRYFEECDYFGYPSADIFFFEQALEPCLGE